MRKTVANDRIRFMVYLFSLRFEDDAGFDTPITEGDSRGGPFIPTEDRRRDHFPVRCIRAALLL
jgi:hypothetical protein